MDLNQTAREILARRGIDPADMPEPKPFDAGEFLEEQAEAALSLALPERFVNVIADHPQVLGWIDRFMADPTTTPSLLMLGPVGTGKSHQAYGALRAIVIGTARRRVRPTWRVTTHPSFNAEMRPQRDDEHLRKFDEYLAADLLVLDDLGAGLTTDWTGDTLYRVVDGRWANRRPTIATSNLLPDVLRETVGDRIASRLAHGVVVALTGSDRRRAGGPA